MMALGKNKYSDTLVAVLKEVKNVNKASGHKYMTFTFDKSLLLHKVMFQ